MTITAQVVETFPWSHHSQSRGLVLSSHGTRLPGMIVVELNDRLEQNITNELQRYTTTHISVVVTKRDKDNKVLERDITVGAYADVDWALARAAIQTALQGS